MVEGGTFVDRGVMLSHATLQQLDRLSIPGMTSSKPTISRRKEWSAGAAAHSQSSLGSGQCAGQPQVRRPADLLQHLLPLA